MKKFIKKRENKTKKVDEFVVVCQINVFYSSGDRYSINENLCIMKFITCFYIRVLQLVRLKQVDPQATHYPRMIGTSLGSNENSSKLFESQVIAISLTLITTIFTKPLTVRKIVVWYSIQCVPISSVLHVPTLNNYPLIPVYNLTDRIFNRIYLSWTKIISWKDQKMGTVRRQ